MESHVLFLFGAVSIKNTMIKQKTEESATFHFLALASLFLSFSSSCLSPLLPPLPLPQTQSLPHSPRFLIPTRSPRCRWRSPSRWQSPTLKRKKSHMMKRSVILHREQGHYSISTISTDKQILNIFRWFLYEPWDNRVLNNSSLKKIQDTNIKVKCRITQDFAWHSQMKRTIF